MINHFEAIVIGSGYGGAIAASRLARAGLRVAVLERGKEYALGDFPDTLAEGAKAFQTNSALGHSGPRDGLFDLHANKDISVLVGCGLGGTSLINGNVMLEPEPRVFEDPIWPAALRADIGGGMAQGYAKARAMLRPVPYPAHIMLDKITALQASATALGGKFSYPPINVTFEEQAGVNAAGVEQPACTLCGDCCSGCNVGAKNTVAMNYLPDAVKHGAQIFTHCAVSHVAHGETASARWAIHYERTDEGGPGGVQVISANHVFVCAGTLGSTEILLRSKARGLTLSDRLGHGFSGNGDVIAFGYNNDVPINGIGVGDPPRTDKVGPVGPVIAGLVDLRSDGPVSENMVIQEGAIPSLLGPLLPTMLAGSSALFGRDTDTGDFWSEAGRTLKSIAHDPYEGAVHNSQTYLVMAHDDHNGRMELNGKGKVSLVWPDVGDLPVYKMIDATLEKATAANGGTYIPNPLWSKALGRNLISVHPLGGCAMGETADSGVVDHACRVFAQNGGFHEGLYAMDGSVMPRSLGVNPSLTISAISERAMALFIERRERGKTV